MRDLDVLHAFSQIALRSSSGIYPIHYSASSFAVAVAASVVAMLVSAASAAAASQASKTRNTHLASLGFAL